MSALATAANGDVYFYLVDDLLSHSDGIDQEASSTPRLPSSASYSRRSALLALPNDVLHLIFAAADTPALLAIQSVDRTLCAALHVRFAPPVWKAARGNTRLYSTVPMLQPPAGVSEARWAELLCGENICTACRRPDVVAERHVTLLRRLCEECVQRETVDISPPFSFTARFPEYANILLQLIPVDVTLKDRSSRLLWPADVHVLAKRHAALSGAVEQRVPGSEERLQDFVWRTEERAKDLLNSITPLRVWEAQVASARTAVERRALARAARPLVDDGFAPEMVCRMLREHDVQARAAMADGGWPAARALLAPLLEETTRAPLDGAALPDSDGTDGARTPRPRDGIGHPSEVPALALGALLSPTGRAQFSDCTPPTSPTAASLLSPTLAARKALTGGGTFECLRCAPHRAFIGRGAIATHVAHRHLVGPEQQSEGVDFRARDGQPEREAPVAQVQAERSARPPLDTQGANVQRVAAA